MTDQKARLEPCPFCGGDVDKGYEPFPCGGRDQPNVQCGNCHASHWDWNHRPTEQAQRELMREAAKILRGLDDSGIVGFLDNELVLIAKLEGEKA